MGETIVIGKRTRELIKGQSESLTKIGLMAAGKTSAYPPYEIRRDRIKGGHVIATFEGAGEFFHEGKWLRSAEGSVCLIPPGNAEAFRAIGGRPWSFCWLHTYPPFFDSFGSKEAAFLEADITLFRHAVEGFIHSAYSEDYADTAAPWADLIRYYAQRFMRSAGSELRLERVWAAVAGEPSRAWSIQDLTRIAGMSREQMRVYSRRETGRSPMQQVAHIRLQRAIEILQTCDYKLEVVAELVGYESPFAFSNALFKSTGKRPSAYRSME